MFTVKCSTEVLDLLFLLSLYHRKNFVANLRCASSLAWLFLHSASRTSHKATNFLYSSMNSDVFSCGQVIVLLSTRVISPKCMIGRQHCNRIVACVKLPHYRIYIGYNTSVRQCQTVALQKSCLKKDISQNATYVSHMLH